MSNGSKSIALPCSCEVNPEHVMHVTYYSHDPSIDNFPSMAFSIQIESGGFFRRLRLGLRHIFFRDKLEWYTTEYFTTPEIMALKDIIDEAHQAIEKHNWFQMDVELKYEKEK